MIAIDKVTPFRSTNEITIESLKWQFYQRLQNIGNTNPLDRLVNGLATGNLSGYQLTQANEQCLLFLIIYYKILILGKPHILEAIKNKIGNYWQNDIYSNGQATAFGHSLLSVFGYKDRFRSKEGKGIWFAKQLNIKSCPYCNSQYTLYVKNTDGSELAKFQFDHFFSKDRYPYFSVSLYNLVPSCAGCNHNKRNEDLNLNEHYHPYHNEIASYASFIVNYPSDIDKLSFAAIQSMDITKLKVSFKSKYEETIDFVSTHDALYDITGVYERHNDIAHEILVKAVLNDRYYQHTIMSISGLFPDKVTVLKYILGSYMTETDMLRRPLSKFTQDLAKQLKLI